MRKNILLILIPMVLGFAACTDLTALNQDPTKSTTINPDLLIPNIQFTQTFGYNNCMRLFIYPGGWCNHFTGPWSMVEYGGKGKKNTSYMERLWQIYYPEIVWDIVSLENITKDNPDYVNQNAMAKVLRVEVFTKLTDYYGDVPYFDAGQGYYQGKLSPKYDKQEDIYMDFFKVLDEAINQFDPTAPTATTDLYFGGDIQKWIRFANSIKLRTAMHLVKVNPELAKQKAQEAYLGGLMTSNDDTAFVKFQNDANDEGAGNGFANAFTSLYNINYGPTQMRITTELLKSLIIQGPDEVQDNNFDGEPDVVFRTIAAQDPRLLLVGRSYTADHLPDAQDVTEIARAYNAVTASQQGPVDLTKDVDGYINIGGYLTEPAQEFNYGGGLQREFGLDVERNVWAQAIKQSQVSGLSVESITHYLQRLQPSKYLQAADSPWIHMSYAETQFLLAEAALRGWTFDAEPASTRYINGLKAAISQWSIFVDDASVPTEAAIDGYAAARMAKYTANPMEEVMTQLWILFMMDPIEAWTLIRRTNGMPGEFVKFYNRYPTENETGGLMPRRMQYPMEEQTKNKANYEDAVNRMGGQDDWMTPVWWDVQ